MDQNRPAKPFFVLNSYADRSIASKIKDNLKKHGFEICMREDKSGWDDSITASEKQHINDSLAVFYLVSPTSRTSPYVREGLKHATICRKNIIPLWIQGNTKWHKVVRSDLFVTVYFDLRMEKYKAGIGEVTELIKNLSDFEARFTCYIEENDDGWLPEVEGIRDQLPTYQTLNQLQRKLPIDITAETDAPTQNMLSERLPRTNVFISCSDEDEEYLREFLVHLKHIHKDDIKVWNRANILLGSDIHDEVKRVIQSTKVAVFLVSADFFASDFIVNYELSPLLAVAESEGVILLPVILKPCDAFYHSPLARFPAFPLPLASIKSVERDIIWSYLAGWFWKILKGQPG